MISAIDALDALLTALCASEGWTYARAHDVPDDLAPGGVLVILDEGGAGEPSRCVGGAPIYYWTHQLRVEIAIAARVLDAPHADFTAVLRRLDAALSQAPTLGGAVKGLYWAPIPPETRQPHGASAEKVGGVMITLEYETQTQVAL